MPLTLIFSIKISILPSDCEARNILDRLCRSVSFACQFNLWLSDFGWLVRLYVGTSDVQRAGLESLASPLRAWTYSKRGVGQLPLQPA